MFFFFFQAEDGIRDYKVTGVQTCALPIYGVADAGRSAGGAEDAGMGGSFASSRSAAPTGSGAGGASEAGGAGVSSRSFTAYTPASSFERSMISASCAWRSSLGERSAPGGPASAPFG